MKLCAVTSADIAPRPTVRRASGEGPGGAADEVRAEDGRDLVWWACAAATSNKAWLGRLSHGAVGVFPAPLSSELGGRRDGARDSGFVSELGEVSDPARKIVRGAFRLGLNFGVLPTTSTFL